MWNGKSLYHGHCFPAAVISQTVRWYFRFQLSLRDIEELLFERGTVVSYATIRRGSDEFGKGFASPQGGSPQARQHEANSLAENSHQPKRERERRMRPIRQHFALKRHPLRASLYRKHLAERFASPVSPCWSGLRL